ncbi:MAG: hypothetical protein IT198_13265 [Acidimicrobiia bacterium]|nr:hypothetical protein [Acidimicrobiia bacterium]
MTDVAWSVTGLLFGMGACALVWWAARDWLTVRGTSGGDTPLSRALVTQNYAGRMVPVTGGIAIVLAVVLAAGVSICVRVATEDLDPATLVRFGLPLSVLVFGFAFLGLLDDVFGGADARGFGGHLRALGAGRLTTGAAKLFGGAAIALVVVAPRRGGLWTLLADAAVVALAANLANLLDRAPGRLLKASVVAAVPLACVGWRGPEVAASAPVLGAAWAMLPPDLREETMLGDTGANVVGATLGWLAVELAGAPTRLVLLGVLVAANAGAELVSYTRVIDAVPPLRWLDRLGRRAA